MFEFSFNRTPVLVIYGVDQSATWVPLVFIKEREHAGPSCCIAFYRIKFWKVNKKKQKKVVVIKYSIWYRLKICYLDLAKNAVLYLCMFLCKLHWMSLISWVCCWVLLLSVVQLCYLLGAQQIACARCSLGGWAGFHSHSSIFGARLFHHNHRGLLHSSQLFPGLPDIYFSQAPAIGQQLSSVFLGKWSPF